MIPSHTHIYRSGMAGWMNQKKRMTVACSPYTGYPFYLSSVQWFNFHSYSLFLRFLNIYRLSTQSLFIIGTVIIAVITAIIITVIITSIYQSTYSNSNW
jgi:hypothetical protein